MSWDILPKPKLQYFLMKLKSKLDKKVENSFSRISFNGKGGNQSTGTFTTGSTDYAVVEVTCGFRPSYIRVVLPFSNGDTYAVYDSEVSTTTSTWTIPMEQRTYTIVLGSSTGESGIVDITDTGFRFRCHANNTRNVNCTYEAVSGLSIAANGESEFVMYAGQTISFDVDINEKTLTINSNALPLSGGEMSGEISFGNGSIYESPLGDFYISSETTTNISGSSIFLTPGNYSSSKVQVNGKMSVSGDLTVTTINGVTPIFSDEKVALTWVTEGRGWVPFRGSNSAATLNASTGLLFDDENVGDGFGSSTLTVGYSVDPNYRTGILQLLNGGEIYFRKSTKNSSLLSLSVESFSSSGEAYILLPFKSGTVALTSDIPIVNNGTLTIQKNGTNVATFSANQSGNATANIAVPTKVSQLTNDLGYTTNVGTITGIKMNGASKGTSGVVDLGTVLTAHQDISGKANKATTLAGYGITDAKIANGVITLGSNTITPLTSHQTVSNKGATLAWATTSTIATIGGTDIKVTMPSNPNTDHYAWTDITDKPSTYTPSSGSAYYVQNLTDASRATTTAKSWVSMMNSSSTGSPVLPTAGKWWHVLSLDCWNSAPNNWVSQLAIATQDSDGVWYRRNIPGESIDKATWKRLAEGDTNGNAITANYANTAGSAPASDVYDWAKASSKPTYTADEVGAAPASHTHDYLPLSGGTMTGELINQKGGIWVQGGSAAGGNVGRMTLSGGMPTELKYNSSKRGLRLYSNAVAIADPYNGNANNDAGWLRHIEETANSGVLELATGDDSNESIVVRQYNTSSAIVREIKLLDSSGDTIFPQNVTAAKFIGSLQGNADTATTASKLGSSNVGSATQPIYLNGGTATACTYTLGKSVPSNAVFTDTNTHRPIQVNGTEILGNNTTALNLKAGTNVSLSNSSGTVTISAATTGITFSNGGSISSTSSASGEAAIEINANGEGIELYGGMYWIESSKLSSILFTDKDHSITLPDKSGTVALTSDLGKYFPIGAVWMTTKKSTETNGNPNTLFGGTWTEVDAGRFLKAVGASGASGNANAVNTGSTTLTAAQSGVPAHSHGLNKHTHSVPNHSHTLDTPTYFINEGGSSSAFGTTASTTLRVTRHTNSSGACTTGAASGGTANNTAANASQGHTHTAGQPASYGLHVWIRTA